MAFSEIFLDRYRCFFCSLLKMKGMLSSSRMLKDLPKCDPSSVTAQSATLV